MAHEASHETDVRDREERRYEAMLGGDADALERLLSDDLVYVHSSGAHDTKRSYLDGVRSGRIRYRRLDHPVAQVKILGDVVVVIGDMSADIVMSGVPTSLDNRTIAVWEREDDWRLVAFQGTPKPRPQRARVDG